MALQFILGASGTGKTKYLYDMVTKLGMEHPETDYYFIVPEQFTLQTQKDLVHCSQVGGIFNIDVLSLSRLAHKVFGELGKEQRKVLKDIGKSMVVKRVLSECQEELHLFGANAGQSGFVEEVKSLFSELFQYGVDEKILRELLEEKQKEKGNELLCKKMQDVIILLEKFKDILGNKYMTSESVFDVLAQCLEESRVMKNCVVILEGFTGFTPSQYALLRQLLRLAKQVYVSLTIPGEVAFRPLDKNSVFSMSVRTMEQVASLAREVGCGIESAVVVGNKDYRHEEGSALHHVWSSLFRYPVKTKLEDVSNELTIYAGTDSRMECRFTVAKILSLLREEGYRYKDIAVIVSDINQYGEKMEQELNKASIPCFLDYKKNMSENTFAEYLKAILKIAEKGFNTEVLISYMKNALSGWEKEQVWNVENYCLAFGIRGHQFQKEWKRTYLPKKRRKRDVSLEELNEIRTNLVEELTPLITAFQTKNSTVKEWTTTLFEFLKNQGIEKKLKLKENEFLEKGDRLHAREYAQVYRVVLDLFDQLVELLGEEKLSAKEYRELVETGLREAKVGLIPTGSEQIVIGDMERTRLREIKALFFLGVNDGKVPAPMDNTGILSEKDRQLLSNDEIEFAPSAIAKACNEQFYLYMNLTKPSKRLYITYAALGEDGKTIGSSYFIGKLQAMFPNLKIQSEFGLPVENLIQNDQGKSAFLTLFREFAMGNKKKDFAELYRWYKGQLSEEALENLKEVAIVKNKKEELTKATAKELYGASIVGSVTRMEQYARCAFAHFLKYGLCLEERQEYRLVAPDIGNLYHDGLKRFGQELQSVGKQWNDISDNERVELVKKCAKEAVEAYATDIFISSAKNKYLTKQMERVLKKTVDVLTIQLENSEFSPVAFEKDFSHTDKHLELRGVIDRVDVCDIEQGQLVKIVDYKSGKQDFSLEELYYGLSMQLAVYMTAELEKRKGNNAIPAAMFYYHIDDPIVNKGKNVKEEVLKALRVKGLVNNNSEIIKNLDKDFCTANGGLAASVNSLKIPVETDKDGGLKKSSKVADGKTFSDISDYVYRKLKEESEEILEGRVEIAPYKCGKNTGCDYCIYASVCGFDRKNGSTYRVLKPMDDDEVLQKLKPSSTEEKTEEKKEGEDQNG